MAKTSTKLGYQSLPLLDHLARVGRRAAEASMSRGGLRPRHLHALGLLSQRGALSQQGLGEVLSLDPSNVVGLLNELEERGLITRRRDPADRRRHIVELSTTGEEALAVAYVRLALVEDDLLAALSAEERATLYHLLVHAAGTESPPCDTTDEEPPNRPVLPHESARRRPGRWRQAQDLSAGQAFSPARGDPALLGEAE